MHEVNGVHEVYDNENENEYENEYENENENVDLVM